MTTFNSSENGLNIRTLEHAGLTWVDVVGPGVAEMAYLKRRFPSFHQLALDDCLSIVQLPKLDEFDDHLFLVLHFPMFDSASRITWPSEVDVFAGQDFVVTIHAGNLRPLVKLFQDLTASEDARGTAMSHGSGRLLYRILDGLVDGNFPIIGRVMNNVNNLEEQVFDTSGQGVVREMALVRRDILSYRRVVRPQIEVLEAMEGQEFGYLGVDEDIYFGDLADHLRRIWSELETLKEVMEGLNDTHGSLIDMRTNDIIRRLTVVATAVLPFLLVSSVLGMNLELPLPGGSWVFGAVLGALLFLSVGLLVFFRLRRWL